MSKDRTIRRYFRDYVKWFPEEWHWELANNESRDLYMKFRARRSELYTNYDKNPFFDSIEKDANQFGLDEVVFTDFFGIRWKGKKGVHRYAGDADYDVHMYYRDPEEVEYDDDEPCVSETVTVFEVPEGYAELNEHGTQEFIDVANIVDVEYRYVVENHLFKDSYVLVSYNNPVGNTVRLSDIEDPDICAVWDIHGLAGALKKFKPELYGKFLAQVDEHFKALQNSRREEERAFAPVDSDGSYLNAQKYFDSYLNNEASLGETEPKGLDPRKI